MTDQIDCVVAGAGVIGLAIARALAITGRDVLVLDAASALGTGISARSSEVLHAGLYYTPGSNRARFCVPGRHALVEYCAARGVATRLCGKLVVATSEGECDELARIQARGTANGVPGLRLLTRAEAIALEPALACTGALLSPSTGIVDSHALMLALAAEAGDHGAIIVCGAPVERAEIIADGFELRVGGRDPARLRCRALVNAAGLGAVQLARAIAGLPATHIPPAYLSKGSYFVLDGRVPFTRLIYPVPIPGGAGIHLTLDMGGQARFGPDVEGVEREDYTVDPDRAPIFAEAVARYWPTLPRERLRPGYAGLRPKIVPPDQTQDFVLQGPETHGQTGLVNLFGIESPGLTSCLAIAAEVVTRL